MILDHKGELFETITFKSGVQVTMYSSTLHKIIYLMTNKNLDYENFEHFREAQNIFNLKTIRQ